MKNRSVRICTGGGGRALPAKLGIEDVSSLCHAELVSASVPCRELPVTPDRFRNKFGMTPPEAVLYLAGRLSVKKCAFTMAEILLSLTIIGVVAAITLPSLTGNINERTWNTQRKALYARFSQAIALMPALNGYGTLTEGDSSTSVVDTAAETFVTEGLSKVLKINNICDNEHLEDCGIANKITTLAGSIISPFPIDMANFNSELLNANASVFVGSNYSHLNTKNAAFETQNGESIVVFYNPNCTANMNLAAAYYTQAVMCANFVYDLNGNKGPNTVGKDIGFMSALYATDSNVVAPYPHIGDTLAGVNQIDGGKACNNLDNEYRLPNRDELASIFYNKNLIGISSSGYWSSSVADIEKAWRLSMDAGYIIPRDKTENYNIRCVKR